MRKIILLVLFAAIVSCQHGSQKEDKFADHWETMLSDKMPYLGHRNWIVVTDMAYPLQTSAGVTTLYADEPYEKVLSKVKKMIDTAPHVYAHIYQDKEFSYISDSEVKGIETLRANIQAICGNELESMPHEKMIAQLDEAGKLFQVIIVKTPLTMPYTSTFFQLDCNYWNTAQQSKLDAAMKGE